MDIHGIRPELQPAALAEKAEQKVALQGNNKATQELVGSNHDAPGIDQATEVSTLTGLGASINTQA